MNVTYTVEPVPNKTDCGVPAGYILNMTGHDEEWIGKQHWAFKLALASPGEWVKRYHVEGIYQFTDAIIYDPDRKLIQVGGFGVRCPLWAWHHVGSTCEMCGQSERPHRTGKR